MCDQFSFSASTAMDDMHTAAGRSYALYSLEAARTLGWGWENSQQQGASDPGLDLLEQSLSLCRGPSWAELHPLPQGL